MPGDRYSPCLTFPIPLLSSELAGPRGPEHKQGSRPPKAWAVDPPPPPTPMPHPHPVQTRFNHQKPGADPESSPSLQICREPRDVSPLICIRACFHRRGGRIQKSIRSPCILSPFVGVLRLPSFRRLRVAGTCEPGWRDWRERRRGLLPSQLQARRTALPWERLQATSAVPSYERPPSVWEAAAYKQP